MKYEYMRPNNVNNKYIKTVTDRKEDIDVNEVELLT